MMKLFVIKGKPTLYHSLEIFRVADVSLVKSIPLPECILLVSDFAQSPNRDIVMIYYSAKNQRCMMSILSMGGEIIRTFDPCLFESFRSSWHPYSFAITDAGDIFVADPTYGVIFLVDSRLTDYQIVSNKDHKIRSPKSILFISEKQQLLVDEGSELYEAYGNYLKAVEHISLFHLSPCSLEKHS